MTIAAIPHTELPLLGVDEKSQIVDAEGTTVELNAYARTGL